MATDPYDAELKLKGFKVYRIQGANAVKTYSRKDFYKVCLVTGTSIIEYADKGIEIRGTTLFFGTPHIPYSWEVVTEDHTGFTCLFTEDFLKAGNRSDSLQQSPLFKIGGDTPIFYLDETQRTFIADLFQKMITEYSSEYIFKDDLMRSYISLFIHEAMKMRPKDNFFKHRDASSRIASFFLELLERQFPIEGPNNPLQLRTAQDYATALSVHVNHLNRSVKEITGKTTSAHIAERIIAEAKALLHHTDWSVADIASGLGFDYSTYFNNYFKKLTGTTPTSLKKAD